MTNMAVLKVSKEERGALTDYQYSLDTSVHTGLPVSLQVRVSLSTQMISTLCTAAQQASEAATDHPRQLRSLGQTIYRLLFYKSHEGQLIASRLADWRDALIVSSNEVEIPWELLHDGTDFLGTRLPVGRQMLTPHIFGLGAPVGQIRSALIVSNPNGDLPAAAAESGRLAAFLKLQGIECTHLSGPAAKFIRVSEELRKGHDIFHYSGHVGLDATDRPSLRLSDMFFAAEDMLAMLAEPGETPTKAPPIVFVNGCSSATHMTSVCGAFLHTGSRIVMGTRYRIDDEAARDFAEAWYGHLLSGMTAGAALRASRSAQRDGPTGTWAAFVLFGQPTIQLWPDGQEPKPVAPPPQETVEPPPGEFWADHAAWLRADVIRLIRRFTDVAAGDIGVVTSFHLAAALLEEETPLSAAIESSDIERATIVDALEIFTTLGFEGEAADPDGEVILSDNVRRVFEQAIQKARADGRVHIGVGDVATAFMAAGGGHAGELLTQLGVELSTEASLFRSGGLNAALVAPETQRAIRCARFMSSTRGEIIGSYSLILGFALANSAIFREALLHQGSQGEKVVRSFFPDGMRVLSRHFSERAHAALEQALVAGDGTVNDAQLLARALSDPGGTASALVQSWGLDRERLLASCEALGGQW